VADGWGCGWSIFWRKGVEIRVALRADWGQIPREKSGVAELRRRLFCKEIFNHTLLWPKETTVTVRKLKSLKKRSRSPCHRRVGKSSGSGGETGGIWGFERSRGGGGRGEYFVDSGGARSSWGGGVKWCSGMQSGKTFESLIAFVGGSI